MFDVTPFLLPERSSFVELLRSFGPDQWATATECLEWDVKGVALHVLGDDLSLLSRQRDEATNGLFFYAADYPDVLTFMDLLDGFNEQWVRATQFLSTALVVELLALTGTWTADYYGAADPMAPGEAVGLFGGSPGQPSPNWHAHAREYVERWVHHSQIRRAVELGPVDAALATPAMEAAVLSIGTRNEALGSFTIGDRRWEFRDGPAISLDPDLAPTVLSLGLRLDDTRAAYNGDTKVVETVATETCRDRREVLRQRQA